MSTDRALFHFEQGDLKLTSSGLWLDGHRSRAVSFVSHAHTDHLARHERSIATPMTARLAVLRKYADRFHRLDFDQEHAIEGSTRIRLVPAGHILGSAMLHATTPEGTLLYTGDFKLRPGLAAERARPCRADVLITETTFGLPAYRFPPRERVIDELIELVRLALASGRQPVVMGYSLGKAQELIAVLHQAGFRVTEHPHMKLFSDAYVEAGVALGERRLYAPSDFSGSAKKPLEERGVLVAAPQFARSRQLAEFDSPVTILASGWAMMPGSRFRYGVDHALPLSDHADFDEIVELYELVKPRVVYCTHGPREAVDHLKKLGIPAKPAMPDRQLSLFD
jgi:Cft2 family RNA processing exonuclease